METSFSFVAVAILGAATGATELINRYRNTPVDITLLNRAAIFYCIVNAIISAIALYFLRELPTEIFLGGTDGGSQEVPESLKSIFTILLAGIGAVVFFRVGLSFHIGGNTIKLNIMSLFDPLLFQADKAVEAKKDAYEIKSAAEIMSDLPIEEAFKNLPEWAFQLRNMDDDTKRVNLSKVEDIKSSELEAALKLNNLGRLLISLIGVDSLAAAKNILANQKKAKVGADKEQPAIAQPQD